MDSHFWPATSDSWLLGNRIRSRVPGRYPVEVIPTIFFIRFCTYPPSGYSTEAVRLLFTRLVSCYRESKIRCWQIMLFLAIADLGGLTCVGTLFGYAMVRGFVFCSDPAFGWAVGCSAYCELLRFKSVADSFNIESGSHLSLRSPQ